MSLELRKEDDGTGELFARFTKQGFSGSGSAWFNLEAVRGFGERLAETFPLKPDERIEIAGGNWSEAAPSQLVEVHLSLSVYPVGAVGKVGIGVEVAAPDAGEGRAAAVSRASAELLTNYERLRAFGQSVQRLCLGAETQVTLVGDDA